MLRVWTASIPLGLGASLALLVVGLAAACASAAAPAGEYRSATPVAESGSRVRVVATTTLLADLARNVGGDRVAVRSLVPPGVDEHSYQTTPRDSITVGQATVIISNGFGLDDFLAPVLAGARQVGAVHVVASEGLEAAPVAVYQFPGEDHEGENDQDELGHAHSAGDPHFWQNPIFAVHYVERIRDGLALADPEHAPTYAANADAYIEQLRELDREIARTLESVPPERRHLVTFHDAFGYFASRYGWQVSAFAPSDASEVTPGAVVTVMQRIREEGIPAVFAEPQFSPDLLQQSARDTGVVVGTIYAQPTAGVPTYIEMMRTNARTLAEHLR